MRSTLSILTASAVLAASGLFVAQATADSTTVTQSTVQTTPPANETATPSTASLPAGVDMKDLNADKAIEKTFKGLTEDAVSKNDFSGVVSYLSDQDKDRVKKSTDKRLNNLDGNDNKALNDVLASLGGAWQSKYNQKFSIDYKTVFNTTNLQVATGVVNDPMAMVNGWPVPVKANASTAGSLTPGDAQVAHDKAFGGIVNLEKGREIAIAHLNAGNGLNGLTASLIHEHMAGWRFDIPNTVDAQRLYNNLVNNLSYLNNNRDAWSTDVNQAYGQVANAVISAMYDIDISQASNRTAMANP